MFSVAYVSRSGGMSNELNNILAHNTNGVFEGIAIGGDRYPGSTYTDHVLRYQDDDRIKMIVMLGEVGGEEEYKIVKALETGRITKPLVAWCIGKLYKFVDYLNWKFRYLCRSHYLGRPIWPRRSKCKCQTRNCGCKECCVEEGWRLCSRLI